MDKGKRPRTINITVRLPERILDDLNTVAKAEGRTRSNLILYLINKGLLAYGLHGDEEEGYGDDGYVGSAGDVH